MTFTVYHIRNSKVQWTIQCRFLMRGKKTQRLSLCCCNKIYEKRKLKKNKKLVSPRAGDWPLRRTAWLHHPPHGRRQNSKRLREPTPSPQALPQGFQPQPGELFLTAMINFKVLKLHCFHCWNKIPEKKPLREWRTYSGPSWQREYPSCQVVTASVVRKQSETDAVALLALALWFYSVGDPGL